MGSWREAWAERGRAGSHSGQEYDGVRASLPRTSGSVVVVARSMTHVVVLVHTNSRSYKLLLKSLGCIPLLWLSYFCALKYHTFFLHFHITEVFITVFFALVALSYLRALNYRTFKLLLSLSHFPSRPRLPWLVITQYYALI